tara:strand:+ start:443 stop:676 length:234 start_codon:yes stop_codon:yes gene_type:complete
MNNKQEQQIFNFLKNLKDAWLNSELKINNKVKPVIFVNSDLINELLGIINQLEQKKKKPNKVILSGNMVEINISKES